MAAAASWSPALFYSPIGPPKPPPLTENAFAFMCENISTFSQRNAVAWGKIRAHEKSRGEKCKGQGGEISIIDWHSVESESGANKDQSDRIRSPGESGETAAASDPPGTS